MLSRGGAYVKRYSLYMEPENEGNIWRNNYLREVLRFVDREKNVADAARAEFFAPRTDSIAKYESDIVKLRSEYRQMLGIPFFEVRCPVSEPVKSYEVAEDDLSRVYRVTIPVIDGLSMYGIWLEARVDNPAPLVIHPTGGNGTPERLCGFYRDAADYRDIVRRFLLKGVHVFVPQFLLWISQKDGDAYNRYNIDMNFKQLGTSIAGYEVFSLEKALDWLTALPCVDKNRVGMAGLSYGGYYTLLTAAADTRIKAAYSSGAYKDSFEHNERDSATDMTFEGAARKFLDNEFIGLICPRPIFVELADNDYLFDAIAGGKRIAQVADVYRALHIPDRFVYRVFKGLHEYPRDDAGFNFIMEHI
jgi:dienelactone hydrolase